MLNTEIAELIQKKSSDMYAISEKVAYNRTLNAEEKEIVEVADAYFKHVGEVGFDRDREISSYVKRVLEEEVYNKPDELLDSFLERGAIGEDDTVVYQSQPKNTLKVYECAKGGVVPRSFINWKEVKATYKNLQVETDLSFRDLRRGGFKTVANLTTMMQEALKNKMIAEVMSKIDATLTSGDNVTTISGGTNTLTQAAVDAMSLYLLERGQNATAICLTKWAQQMRSLTGYSAFASENMKDEFNRYGIVNMIQGLNVASISGAHKTGLGETMIPADRIFGVVTSKKVGNLDIVGETHVYQEENAQNETIHLMAKDMSFAVAITNPENMYKIAFTS